MEKCFGIEMIKKINLAKAMIRSKLLVQYKETDLILLTISSRMQKSQNQTEPGRSRVVLTLTSNSCYLYIFIYLLHMLYLKRYFPVFTGLLINISLLLCFING